MKIRVPKHSFGVLLTKKLGGRPVWLIVLCFLTAICGTYVLKNHFGLWVIVGLGIAGIFVGGRVNALLNLNKTHGTHSARAKNSVPQITSGWEYRPKDATRRDASVDRGGVLGAEAVGSSPSSPNENANVWLNFANLEPTVEKATIKDPL